MPGYFQIGDFIFFPHKNEIHRAEEIIKVRPKTADLLTALLDANGDIVSKADLLKRVWSDVAAEEYVVFQSVAELRKIFNDAKIIKTHPRKGYSVAVAINKFPDKPAPGSEEASSSTLTQTTALTSTALAPTHKPNPGVPPQIVGSTTGLSRRSVLYTLLALVLAAITILGYNIEFQQQKKTANSGSIVILPVNNRIAGAEHMWMRYGGMDQLIETLQPHVNALVLPTEMVLETIQRANIAHDNIAESDIARLFEVSGAQLIVTQSISGFSGEFQLVYGLYEDRDVTRGVLFADDTDTLFSQLNAVLLQSMGVTEKSASRSYQHHFTSAMMATAIDETQLGNHQQAATMFKAVLVAEPKNVLAIRMLVKSLVHIGRYEEAESVAADAVKYVMQSGDNRNLGRLFFWQAVSITQQHRYDDALSVLHYAKAKSEHTSDVLYLANISRIAGKLYLQKKQFDLARGEISQALSLYKSINEPYGQSSMYIDLGELELALNHPQNARKAFEKALEVASRSRLNQLIELTNEWLGKI